MYMLHVACACGMWGGAAWWYDVAQRGMARHGLARLARHGTAHGVVRRGAARLGAACMAWRDLARGAHTMRAVAKRVDGTEAAADSDDHNRVGTSRSHIGDGECAARRGTPSTVERLVERMGQPRREALGERQAHARRPRPRRPAAGGGAVSGGVRGGGSVR
eukprot:417683-Prymnesium_polylepis.1